MARGEAECITASQDSLGDRWLLNRWHRWENQETPESNNDEDEVHYFNACTSRNAYPGRHTCRKPQPPLVQGAERASTLSPSPPCLMTTIPDAIRHPVCSLLSRRPPGSGLALVCLCVSARFTYERSFQWLPSTNKLMAQKVALICASAVKPIASCSQRKHVSACLGAMLGYRRSTHFLPPDQTVRGAGLGPIQCALHDPIPLSCSKYQVWRLDKVAWKQNERSGARQSRRLLITTQGVSMGDTNKNINLSLHLTSTLDTSRHMMTRCPSGSHY